MKPNTTSSPTDDPEVQALLEVPKAKLGGLVVAVTTQAKLVLLYSSSVYAAVLATAGLLVLLFTDDPGEAFAPWFGGTTAVAATPLLIGLLMWLWAWMNHCHFKLLREGAYLVHWTYQPQQWRPYIEQRHKEFRANLWIMPAVFGGIGAMVGLIAWLDDNPMIFESQLLTGLVLSAGGAIAGLVLNFFILRLGNVAHRLKTTADAQCVIGLKGLYITGEYWPWSTYGQSLQAVEFDPATPDQLLFVFRSTSGHGSIDKKVPLPVPPGQQSVAAAVARLLC